MGITRRQIVHGQEDICLCRVKVIFYYIYRLMYEFLLNSVSQIRYDP